jgi:hypothetical protein
LQYQGFCTPDGLLWLVGPYVGHFNDLNVLYAEDNSQTAALKALPAGHYVIADGIYPCRMFPWLYSTKLASAREQIMIGNLRSSVEHAFGAVSRKWAFLDFVPAHKVWQTAPALTYELGVFLCNLVNILRGNQIRRRFEAAPPSITPPQSCVGDRIVSFTN